MKPSVTVRIAIVAAVFVGLPLYWSIFPPREPLADANGVYSNSCCGSISIQDGVLIVANDRANYVVEHDKIGRYVLPDRSVGIVNGEILLGNQAYPLKMRLDESRPPRTIKIVGDQDAIVFHRGR